MQRHNILALNAAVEAARAHRSAAAESLSQQVQLLMSTVSRFRLKAA